MRWCAAVILIAVAAACAPRLYAEDASSDTDNAARPVHLNRPQDFAPPDMVIVPRPAEEYLPPGSLLAGGARAPRQVDLDELRRRKLAMYEGTPAIDALPSAEGAGPAASLLVRPEVPNTETDYGALVFWTLVAAAGIAAALFLVHALIHLKARAASRHAPSRVSERAGKR